MEKITKTELLSSFRKSLEKKRDQMKTKNPLEWQKFLDLRRITKPDEIINTMI
jgi:hypothetical protein